MSPRVMGSRYPGQDSGFRVVIPKTTKICHTVSV